MNTILLSVRPPFARAIMAGTKTAEVRRRFPYQPVGSTVLIYSTTPDCAILGSVQLDSIDHPETRDVWRLYKDKIKIDQSALDQYLDEASFAAILHVSSPVHWPVPVPLKELRRLTGVEPPQSFRYLETDHVRVLLDFAHSRSEVESALQPAILATG
jgi:predicted transcriptional regulator